MMSVLPVLPAALRSSAPHTARTWHHLALRQARRMATALALMGVLAACNQPSGPASGQGSGPSARQAAPKVGVVTLQTQSQSLQEILPGRVQAQQIAQIRPQVSGIVQKQLFREGATVQAGQALYQLDATLLQAAAASAEAALAKAQANAQRLQLQAKRSAGLVAIDAISTQQHEDNQAAAAVAQAEVAAAQAQLHTARTQLRYARIESPIAGRVSLSSVTPGALVTANQATALTEVVQTDPMYVDFTQSTAQLLQLQRDWEAGRYEKVNNDTMPIAIDLEDGSRYPHAAKLQFSGLIANPSMGTVTLRAVVPNPQGQLLPGMFVQAHLPTGRAPKALLLPQQAVSRDLTGRASVLVVQEVDSAPVAVKRPVELTQAVGSHWLVESGLQAGEQVVVEGFQRIKPGDKVQPVVLDLSQPRSVEKVDPQAAAASLRASVGGTASTPTTPAKAQTAGPNAKD